jgi:predicted  nucleic acid-binding Zn-ribbon protein
MPYYCTECGGELSYDMSLKQYSCKSCGLTFTFQQIVEAKDRMLDSKSTADEERKQKQKEYLKWWLSKK